MWQLNIFDKLKQKFNPHVNITTLSTKRVYIYTSVKELTYILCHIYWQNLFDSFTYPSRVVLDFITLRFRLQRWCSSWDGNVTLSLCATDWNITPAFQWTSMKFSTEINGPQIMNSPEISDPLNFSPALPRGWHILYLMKYVCTYSTAMRLFVPQRLSKPGGTLRWQTPDFSRKYSTLARSCSCWRGLKFRKERTTSWWG